MSRIAFMTVALLFEEWDDPVSRQPFDSGGSSTKLDRARVRAIADQLPIIDWRA